MQRKEEACSQRAWRTDITFPCKIDPVAGLNHRAWTEEEPEMTLLSRPSTRFSVIFHFLLYMKYQVMLDPNIEGITGSI
jgi:hypothetical protein